MKRIQKQAVGKKKVSPQTTRRRRRRVISKSRIKIITFSILCFIFWGIFLLLDNAFFNIVYNSISHKPTEGDFAGNLIYKAINLHHSISENPNNTPRLLELLNEPVKWYSAKDRMHNRLKFGSPYDKFAFIDVLRYDYQDHRRNNYEVRFDGVYRRRHPKNTLLEFESGLAIIEEGKISELVPQDKPNEYKYRGINTLFQWYNLAALAAAFIFTLLIVSLSSLPQNLVALIPRAIQKYFGF